MPMTIFDWVARTAMLVMAGLVTLSILGSIAAMTNDPGSGLAPAGRPPIEADRTPEREAERAPAAAGESNPAGAAPAGGREADLAVAPPAGEDTQARWLEAIAYALLALAGLGALAVLMLLSIVRELRRIGRRPQ